MIIQAATPGSPHLIIIKVFHIFSCFVLLHAGGTSHHPVILVITAAVVEKYFNVCV